MKNKSKQLEDIRKKTGDRLDELMKAKHMTSTYLLQKAELSMSRQQFSQIKNKHRTLQREDAIKLSNVFGTDPGYLLGVDDFKAASYNDYINIMKDAHDLNLSLQGFHHYDYILNLIDGYKLVEASLVNDSASDYTYLGNNVSGKNEKNIQVRRSGIVATIPASEMERFESDVLDYIKVRFDALMMRYRDEEEEQRLKSDKYSYMHPGRRK